MAAVPGATTELPRGAELRADVVVVGAGPAGSSAAFWLSRAGLGADGLAGAAGRLRGGGLRPAGEGTGPGAPGGPAPRCRRPPVRALAAHRRRVPRHLLRPLRRGSDGGLDARLRVGVRSRRR